MPTISFSGVPVAVRPESAAALMRVIHTAEDLTHQSKSARYNIRGQPDEDYVGQLAALTEDVAHTMVDVLVARVQVLGQPVAYTLAAVAEGSVLTPFPLDLQDGVEITAQLGQSWMVLAELASEQIGVLRGLGDSVSAHILEHRLMDLEAASSNLQEIVGARDPEEAVEHQAIKGQLD